MLELSDPLWKKLDSAFRYVDVPGLLGKLGDVWDDETANSLLWDTLCHQGTCYGTTYAAVPHLLKIAEHDGKHPRFELAVFLGYVALCALEPQQRPRDELQQNTLQGLPETLEGWDRKLDCYRSLVASLEGPTRASSNDEQMQLLPHYKEVLAIEPVGPADLERIRSIRSEFLSALPHISALCERALVEHLEDKDAVRYLLSGIASADGLLTIGRLVNSGPDGLLRCSNCDWGFQYMLFGDRVAIYADDAPTARSLPPYADRVLRDHQDRAPSRADGFLAPAACDQILE